MHNIEKIKKTENKPKVLENIFNKDEIQDFIDLYKKLPTTVHNKKQNVIKKRWLLGYSKKLEDLYVNKLKDEIGDFKMDNLKTDEGDEIYGLFQESYNPIGLHVDAGFNPKDHIYRQCLVPLTPVGSTVIFKNRFYGNSTNFTTDKEELERKNLNYGQNTRSSEHLQMYGGRTFDKEIHKKFLNHEDINNLKGLKVEMIYKWKLGDLLIFDRTNLHCSSSNLKKKKIGFTTSTIKK